MFLRKLTQKIGELFASPSSVRTWAPQIGVVFALIVMLELVGFFQSLDRGAYNWLRRVGGGRAQDLSVVVVSASDETQEAWGQSPWPAQNLSAVQRRIAEGSPAAIVLAQGESFQEPAAGSPDALALQELKAESERWRSEIQSELGDEETVESKSVEMPRIPVIPMHRVLSGELPSYLFTDKLVVLGVTGENVARYVSRPDGLYTATDSLARDLNRLVQEKKFSSYWRLILAAAGVFLFFVLVHRGAHRSFRQSAWLAAGISLAVMLVDLLFAWTLAFVALGSCFHFSLWSALFASTWHRLRDAKNSLRNLSFDLAAPDELSAAAKGFAWMGWGQQTHSAANRFFSGKQVSEFFERRGDHLLRVARFPSLQLLGNEETPTGSFSADKISLNDPRLAALWTRRMPMPLSALKRSLALPGEEEIWLCPLVSHQDSHGNREQVFGLWLIRLPADQLTRQPPVGLGKGLQSLLGDLEQAYAAFQLERVIAAKVARHNDEASLVDEIALIRDRWQRIKGLGKEPISAPAEIAASKARDVDPAWVYVEPKRGTQGQHRPHPNPPRFGNGNPNQVHRSNGPNPLKSQEERTFSMPGGEQKRSPKGPSRALN